MSPVVYLVHCRKGNDRSSRSHCVHIHTSWTGWQREFDKRDKEEKLLYFRSLSKRKESQKQKSMKSECVSVCVWAAVGRMMTHIRDPNGFV